MASLSLIPDNIMKVILAALAHVLPRGFTGSVTIRLNYHAGTAASATCGYEEGQKLT